MNKMLHVAPLLILWSLSTATFAQQQTCSLTVEVTPPDSRVKIMNITPIYRPGIVLGCGKSYDILVEKQGYIPNRQWVKVSQPNSIFNVILEKPSRSTFEAIKAGTLEHKEKTLGALDRVFQNHRPDYLDKISTARFQSSGWYNTLRGYVSSHRLNLNHTSETATQEFIINGNEEHVLVVDFDKSKRTNLWYIADAYVKMGRTTQPLREHGFRPLQFESHFSDLVRKIKTGKIWAYYGLAPHGKLNSHFFKSKKLSLSRNKSLKIKDVIIHDGSKVSDIISLTLRYYPAGYREGASYKSGWLLDDGESMATVYQPGENLYFDLMFRRNLLNLNAPNEGLIFFNLAQLDRKKPDSGASSLHTPSRMTDSGGTTDQITGMHCGRTTICSGCFRIIFKGSYPPIEDILHNKNTVKQDKKTGVIRKT